MMSTMTTEQNRLKQVLKCGQSIWYDGLMGVAELRRMIEEDGLRGATTNPTIFEKAIVSGDYDAELRQFSKSENVEAVYQKLAVQAVQGVADVFRVVFQETRGNDGFVSIEVSPLLAYDTQATIREGRELWQKVARSNVMIKVPATREGLGAIETLISEGINVNVTLIFSIERYLEVMNSYQAGLERRDRAGKPISGIASVASFFVSRVDTAIDKILEEKIKSSCEPDLQSSLKQLLGKAAIANSKVAYAEFEKVFSSTRFQALESQAAKVQRPLWASTGTKNLNYSDVLYVEALIGPDSVDTMPPATLAAFKKHGVAVSRIQENLKEATHTLAQLANLGINLMQVTQTLEEVGVKAFADSYEGLLKAIQNKR